MSFSNVIVIPEASTSDNIIKASPLKLLGGHLEQTIRHQIQGLGGLVVNPRPPPVAWQDTHVTSEAICQTRARLGNQLPPGGDVMEQKKRF